MPIFIRVSILYSLKLLTRSTISGIPTIIMIMWPSTLKNFMRRALIEIQKYENNTLPMNILTKLL